MKRTLVDSHGQDVVLRPLVNERYVHVFDALQNRNVGQVYLPDLQLTPGMPEPTPGGGAFRLDPSLRALLFRHPGGLEKWS